MSLLPTHRLPLLAFSLWLLPAVAVAAPAAAIATLDRILVVVNDDIVTQSELNLRVAETKKQLQIKKITPPPDDVLRRQVLDHLVLERVQLQIASQTGLRVSEADIDKTFESIARQNKMSVEEFQQFLRREGLDPSTHRTNVRNQLLIRQLQEREILSRIVVTDAEVSAFLENQETRDSVNLAFELSHIFIPIPESASPEAVAQAKARAEEALQRLRQGGDFAQTAISFSQGPEALSGGNLGWRNAGQLPDLFLTAIKNLTSGNLTDILRGPNGFHILRVNDRRGDVRTERVAQTRVRHILIKSSEIQSLNDARTKLTQLRERIENGEDFATLARAHSEDPGSTANGGDLGWVNPGQLVPEFEKAMSELKPNELSAPVRSPFGLHLIQVLERRDQDVTQERTRGVARNQIHARKADERYEQWARQLRDEAFVEYLPDETN